MNTADSLVKDLDGTVYFRLSELASLSISGPGELRVMRGRAWVTINDQPRDWFLVRGKFLSLATGQKLLAQADPDCILGWREPVKQQGLRLRWKRSLNRIFRS
jgi:Protein of unknown function (DUF2917)